MYQSQKASHVLWLTVHVRIRMNKHSFEDSVKTFLVMRSSGDPSHISRLERIVLDRRSSVSYVILKTEDNRSLSVIDNQDQWFFLISSDFGSWRNEHSNNESLYFVLQLLKKKVVHFQYQRIRHSSVQIHSKSWTKKHSNLAFNRIDFVWFKKEERREADHM